MDTGARFREGFGVDPEVRVRAPGRVNLMGEHTDYTGGTVLPLAIDRFLEAAASRRRDGVIRIEAPLVGGSAELRADGIPQARKETWLNYVLGVVAELWALGDLRSGFNLLLAGNLPAGAGLASSAAVTVGTAYALSALFELGARDLDLILAAQRAEHRFVGVQCGIMDQAASAVSLKDHALLIDCRTLEMRPVPFADGELCVAVCHTGVKHRLAESGYNLRVAECREALELIRRERRGLACLGELGSVDLLDLHRILPERLARRLDHVVLENQRVRAATAFLEGGDLESFGRMMFTSHESLRDRYEVSCPELDALFEAARAQSDTVLGAKMTGAGFGGAIVCLVREAKFEDFERRLREAYEKATGRAPTVALCRSAEGARESLVTGRAR
jgi:galactokinase